MIKHEIRWEYILVICIILGTLSFPDLARRFFFLAVSIILCK